MAFASISNQNTPLALELADLSVFKDLSYDLLEGIAQFCTKRILVVGDELISEHSNSGSDLYILLRGKVEIISNGSGVTSDEITLSKHDKEIFGEISWLLKNNRTATIRCLSEVEAIEIQGSQFMHYLEQHPETGFVVMRNIARLLASRLIHADSLLKQILWNSFV